MTIQKPVAVDGLADQSAQTSALSSEGFAGVAAYIKPPEGLAAAGDAPVKVEGFGGGATAGAAPPVEGFGDSADNRGLENKSEDGYLDQEDEESYSLKKREVDLYPGSEEEANNESAKAERLDLEPGWEEADKEASGDQENEEESDDKNSPDEQTRLVPYAKLFVGNHRFTAQLKAHGYGGFHEWKMQMVKQLMEKGT